MTTRAGRCSACCARTCPTRRCRRRPRTATADQTEQARTDYVLGEFYWRVRVGDTAEVTQVPRPARPLLVQGTHRRRDHLVARRQVPDADRCARRSSLSPTRGQGSARGERERTDARVLWTRGRRLLVLLLLADARWRRPVDRVRVFSRRFTVTAVEPRRGRSPPSRSPFRTAAAICGSTSTRRSEQLGRARASRSSGQGGGPSFDATRTIEYYTGYDSDGVVDGGQPDRPRHLPQRPRRHLPAAGRDRCRRFRSRRRPRRARPQPFACRCCGRSSVARLPHRRRRRRRSRPYRSRSRSGGMCRRRSSSGSRCCCSCPIRSIGCCSAGACMMRPRARFCRLLPADPARASTVARYQGWTLFGSSGRAASRRGRAARGGGGSSGFHK